MGCGKMRNTKDKVMQFLLDKRKTVADTHVIFAVKDYDNKKLKRIKADKIVESMNKLTADGYIEYSRRGNEGAFNIKLLPTASNYFDDKKAKSKVKFREMYRFWIPTTLSIIAILLSLAEYFGLQVRIQ